ncbi:hypothetical protein EJ05DRAFT_531035 [Pseudovirgaria hyperparasitica]|uniref:CNH domain-containing protein n=1 Tax=Pseudovirgaria hyperparasitica TaxID=470096 RepID=A0A6A6WEA5_9PEZI|nr:uncharacterized protein EJ05DRAFT_531035 [Pseudovirgaria hyperparasitica]KAF2760489.1 hypothetical protein EJ05DRAFT_531035 [Pseudovirgaria hyperparasitica]
MLSAFTARPIVEFKQRDKSKIESILAFGDRVLVGLQSGALRIYRVNELHDQDVPEVQDVDGVEGEEVHEEKIKLADLLREEEKFSRRPVQQLAIIKEASILLSLSDSYVSIHDLNSYALQERLERTKGATTFAVTSDIVIKDEIPSIVTKLAVAVKRKILIWSWQDMEVDEEVTEMTLIAAVKSLTWSTRTKLVAGMDPGFVMVDVDSQEITDINKPSALGEAGPPGSARFGSVNSSGMGYMGMGSWIPKPLATRLKEGQMLLAKDVNTLFIDEDGNALDKRQIPWPSAPESLGYSYPYMLALSAPAKGALEVRNPDTLSLLQSIALPNASFIHVPQPYISLAHAGKGFLVASDRCIWRMGALDYDTQIEDLIHSGRYDEAISLLNMLEDTLLKDKEGQLRRVKILKAQGFFHQKRYQDAMDLFGEAHAPPELVVALYPKSIAGELSSFEAEQEPENEAAAEPPTEGSSSVPASPNKSTLGTASTLGRAMFGKWKAEHKVPDSDAASIRSEKPSMDDSASVRGKPAVDKPLEGKDFLKAVHALQGFLAESRKQIQKFINFDGTLKQPLPTSSDSQVEPEKPAFQKFILEPEEGDIDWTQKLLEVAITVDTVLFRAYMIRSPTMAGSLFRIENFCDPEVVKEKLYDNGRYLDLIDFLHGKKLHREALELLEKFGKDAAEQSGNPALKGPQRMVGYLQQLPPDLVELIFEFVKWPLEADPKLGMEVFVADTKNADDLPRHRVAEYLENFDYKLAVAYLEHIIYEPHINEGEPHFHQKLIDLYLRRLKSSEGGEFGDFSSEEERTQWKESLEKILKTSTHYHRAKAFSQLPSEDPMYYESRAIVLSSMGQHKQALQIYVFNIQSPQKAEEYANEIYRSTHPALDSTSHPLHATPDTSPDDDADPGIYLTLLALYLAPPHPHKPQWEPALTLLSKHGARLPAGSTLALIPPSLPVADLESYFRGRVRTANSVLRQERMLASLRSVVKLDVDAALLLGEARAGGGLAAVDDEKRAMTKGMMGGGGRNRRVLITEDRHCKVCGKRFGGSAIRVFPDNSVVHYGCVDRSVGRKGAARAW